MEPTFTFIGTSTAYVAILPKDETGGIIEPDGVTYFSLAQASERAGVAPDVLGAAWSAHFAQYDGEDLRPAEADSDRIRQREAYIERLLAGFTANQRDDILTQARELGYDLVRGDCYPAIVEDSDGKRRGVIAVKLATMLDRVARSRELNGGPVFEYRLPSGEWVPDMPPKAIACRAAFYRVGFERPWVVERLLDNVMKDTWYWREYETEALRKCTYAAGVRETLPHIIGQVYEPSELSEKKAGTLKLAGTEEPPDLTSGRGVREHMAANGMADRDAQTAFIQQVSRDTRMDDDADGMVFWKAVVDAFNNKHKRRRG